MKFRKNIVTREIETLAANTDFALLDGAHHNGQHYQLPGFILAELKLPDGDMCLWHPETSESSGHVDVIYNPRRHDQKYGVSIRLSVMSYELDFSNDNEVKNCWPSGAWHLLQTIDAFERHLEKELGYEPQLSTYIGRTFQQTPNPEPVATPIPD